ncbi:hypothetical protein ElyMa_005620600 [Elysia marginata]|uniref:Uncharacterized protein n=1 Tax=Elysia marginata TaxID=1093978 RepID=A0AAV4F6P0_9GAST|nr:hypothetical protein ElyMa_005620600 [Elysia marginata]
MEIKSSVVILFCAFFFLKPDAHLATETYSDTNQNNTKDATENQNNITSFNGSDTNVNQNGATPTETTEPTEKVRTHKKSVIVSRDDIEVEIESEIKIETEEFNIRELKNENSNQFKETKKYYEGELKESLSKLPNFKKVEVTSFRDLDTGVDGNKQSHGRSKDFDTAVDGNEQYHGGSKELDTRVDGNKQSDGGSKDLDTAVDGNKQSHGR